MEVGGGGFRVEKALLQLPQSVGHQWKLFCPVVALARENAEVVSVEMRLDAIATEIDLVHPIVTLRRGLLQRRIEDRDVLWHSPSMAANAGCRRSGAVGVCPAVGPSRWRLKDLEHFEYPPGEQSKNCQIQPQHQGSGELIEARPLRNHRLAIEHRSSRQVCFV